MISYILLTPAVRPFVKIYIDIIGYDFPLEKGYRYIVYILDRYFNHHWIFFIKTKETIF